MEHRTDIRHEPDDPRRPRRAWPHRPIARQRLRRQRQILIVLVALLASVTVFTAILKAASLAGQDKGPGGNPSDVNTGAPIDTGKLVVVLDAGHGGTDPGAQVKDPDGSSRSESDINLSMTVQVARRLEQLGVQVVLTRSADDWVSLYSRIAQTSLLSLDWLESRKPASLPSASQLAALQKALRIPIEINSDNRDSGGLGFMAGYGVGKLQKALMDVQRSCSGVLFVSIHGNSSANRSLSGMQIYYCDDAIVAREEAGPLSTQTTPAGNIAYANRDAERSRQLANRIYQSVTGALPALADTNAGEPVLSGNYAVLREQALASVLIETGYLSNTADLALLLDDSNRIRLADAIADGIHRYAKDRRLTA